MTLAQTYQAVKQRLANAGLEDPAAEAAVFMEHFFGLSRGQLIVRGEAAAPESVVQRLEAAVQQRISHRPLQYILGSWEFLGLNLSVGEGVLIPREDTAVLVEAVAAFVKGMPQAVGADLCAGTGAVALAVCNINPQVKITAVELSDAAFVFLQENCRRYPQFPLTLVRGDISDPGLIGQFPPCSLDFIASNPPYIESGALPFLQPEVRKEPARALDGGADGLQFYRILTKSWVSRLKPGGLLAVEIGETQGEAVKKMFKENGLVQVQVHRDMANHSRTVTGQRVT